jgi:hypothetical protein
MNGRILALRDTARDFALAISTIAVLLYSAGSSAGCSKPEWPDPISFKDSANGSQMLVRHTFPFQSGVYEFIACQSIDQCFRISKRESDPAIARAECERVIEGALRDRRQNGLPQNPELTNEQHSAYGGVWSYRTLDLGRPGRCMDSPCDQMLGVEVTNMTPVVLSCEVVLTVSNRQEGKRRSEQMITLNPGDALPTLLRRTSSLQ